jgi:hypothetical protein
MHRVSVLGEMCRGCDEMFQGHAVREGPSLKEQEHYIFADLRTVQASCDDYEFSLACE